MLFAPLERFDGRVFFVSLPTATMPMMVVSAGCASSPSTSDDAASAPASQTSGQASDDDTGESFSSIRLDRDALKKFSTSLFDDLVASKIAADWQKSAADGTPSSVVAVTFNSTARPPQNAAVSSLSAKLETRLVNDTAAAPYFFSAKVGTFNKVFDKYGKRSNEMLADFGREIDADYVVSGDVSADKELTDDTKQITYTAVMYVVDTNTSEIVYDTRAKVTKSR